MPPSIVVVAWTALGTAKAAREFLGGGARGMRGVRPGLPVVVFGGESDGEVRRKYKVICSQISGNYIETTEWLLVGRCRIRTIYLRKGNMFRSDAMRNFSLYIYIYIFYFFCWRVAQHSLRVIGDVYGQGERPRTNQSVTASFKN